MMPYVDIEYQHKEKNIELNILEYLQKTCNKRSDKTEPNQTERTEHEVICINYACRSLQQV